MKRTGLTLVEVLVVVSIIAILMAITMPVLRRCRQYAKAVMCASNISQLGKALFVYESTYDSFPYGIDMEATRRPEGGYAGNAAWDKMGWWWLNNLIEYDSMDRGYGTPALCPAKRLNNWMLDPDLLIANYGINMYICKNPTDFKVYREMGFVGEPLGLGNIRRPGETLLVCDSGYAVITWMHATDEPPVKLGRRIEDMAYIPGLGINRKRVKDKTIWPGLEDDAIYGRHPNKSINVGYVDGHVSRVKAEKVFVEYKEDGYRNLNPLWLPK